MAAGVAVFAFLMAMFTDYGVWWMVCVVALFAWLLGDHKPR